MARCASTVASVALNTCLGRAHVAEESLADRLKDTPGDTPHDMAFLTVMSAVKDVARHLENIAERIGTEKI